MDVPAVQVVPGDGRLLPPPSPPPPTSPPPLHLHLHLHSSIPSFQRFAETWALLERVAGAGLLAPGGLLHGLVHPNQATGESWRLVSLGGGPGFELLAADWFVKWWVASGGKDDDTSYLASGKFEDAPPPNNLAYVSLDLQPSWDAYAPPAPFPPIARLRFSHLSPQPSIHAPRTPPLAPQVRPRARLPLRAVGRARRRRRAGVRRRLGPRRAGGEGRRGGGRGGGASRGAQGDRGRRCGVT